MDEVIELRKLVIKTFHIESIKFSDDTRIDGRTLYIKNNIALNKYNKDFIKCLEVNIINPNERNIFVNSILDFEPIATKVLGEMGEGITHVLTGVTVMINGKDENDVQIAEFGSSEGILKEQVIFDRAGTPSKDDIILQFNVVLNAGMGVKREAITEIHKSCDLIVQEIREVLKKFNGNNCNERHEYYDKVRKNQKKVLIVKQVAGQGAMYDTGLLASEPCGAMGTHSIIDMGNVPVILTPNEYRDGALRAMH